LTVEFRQAVKLDKDALKDHVIKLGYQFAKEFDIRENKGKLSTTSKLGKLSKKSKKDADKDAFIEKKEFRMFLKYI
jgi:hypothetical protein